MATDYIQWKNRLVFLATNRPKLKHFLFRIKIAVDVPCICWWTWLFEKKLFLIFFGSRAPRFGYFEKKTTATVSSRIKTTHQTLLWPLLWQRTTSDNHFGYAPSRAEVSLNSSYELWVMRPVPGLLRPVEEFSDLCSRSTNVYLLMTWLF